MFDVTVSFDNGPSPGVTAAVLDVLRGHDVLSTFFVVGKHAVLDGSPDLMRRARAEGHWIGNHSWTHSVPLGLRPGPRTVADELEATDRVIGDLAHPDRFFRPFGGGGNLDARLLSPDVVEYLVRTKATCVLWNVVPRDWVDIDGWVETALAACAARPWSLVVLHDLPTGAMRHLPRFIEAVRARGGRFRQDFPPDCTPIVRGEIVGPLREYVTPAS